MQYHGCAKTKAVILTKKARERVCFLHKNAQILHKGCAAPISSGPRVIGWLSEGRSRCYCQLPVGYLFAAKLVILKDQQLNPAAAAASICKRRSSVSRPGSINTGANRGGISPVYALWKMQEKGCVFEQKVYCSTTVQYPTHLLCRVTSLTRYPTPSIWCRVPSQTSCPSQKCVGYWLIL